MISISLSSIDTTFLKNGLWSLSMLLFNGFNEIRIKFRKILKNWSKYTHKRAFFKPFRSELGAGKKWMADSRPVYKNLWEKSTLVPETHLCCLV